MVSVLILIICIAYTTLCLSPTFNMNHSILSKKCKSGTLYCYKLTNDGHMKLKLKEIVSYSKYHTIFPDDCSLK